MRWIGLGAKAAGAAAAVLMCANTAQAATDYPALIRAMSAAIAAKYYEPHLHGADWPALTRRYEGDARGVRTDAEFQMLAKAMLANLKSSHVYVVAPGADADGWRPAFKTRKLQGVHTVIEVSDLSDARAQGVKPGDVVTNWSALPGVLGTRTQVGLSDCTGAPRSLSVRRESVFWPPPAPSFRWRRLPRRAQDNAGLPAGGRLRGRRRRARRQGHGRPSATPTASSSTCAATTAATRPPYVWPAISSAPPARA